LSKRYKFEHNKTNRGYYDNIKKIPNLNKMGELSKVCAPIIIIVFEYKMYKHGIITPPLYLKRNTCSSEYRYEIKHTLAISIS
jgi:hypothetical protein